MFSLSLFNVFMACGEKGTDTATSTESTIDIATFEAHLTGNFNSAQQAEENYNYYPVSLIACSVEVPELGEHVLYIEQALMSSLNEPYRQRVYQLEDLGDNTMRSHIYEIQNPLALTGLCDQNERSVAVERLSKKEGCAVTLSWNGAGFEGQTEKGTCLSDMNGASYATSIVTTTESSIQSWDQGWDSNHQQVWGAVEGAYIFIRQ